MRRGIKRTLSRQMRGQIKTNSEALLLTIISERGMNMYAEREMLNLKNMEELNSQVEKLIPAVVNSLKDDSQSASITVTLTFKLCEDSDTHIKMTSKVKPSFASESKALLCARDLVGNLSADPLDLGKNRIPREKSLFPAEEPSKN